MANYKYNRGDFVWVIDELGRPRQGVIKDRSIGLWTGTPCYGLHFGNYMEDYEEWEIKQTKEEALKLRERLYGKVD